ncbi:ras guanine nucleotide exchange factor domain-containing protein [Halteromyces radiatus]|uniref:ras guanine nucleotide exchange factor domain-containing protein n=1 Tax=Halteromyces radiatus TaxID=101107 RepID=UPI00222066C6|nr:ras guanine nucleotide exchange factor domain-containing protein [Halteromyces radiatus]KAI8089712.1 ras guanine nucleotide exchange factor domain-containing protein [Halteromyces radiatus]
MKMTNGRLQVEAGTAEKLFIKLADETTQDFNYVDAYILNHIDFTTSEEFLENLMARFHIEPQPGETEYFRKWQRCIQIKVLNVISRWIKLQYNDFKVNPILLTRLQAFINGDITRGGFMMEANNIKELLHTQVIQHSKNHHSFIYSIISAARSSSPSTSSSSSSSFILFLDAKQVSQYLTLMDFYLLKCITIDDYLHGKWRNRNKNNNISESRSNKDQDYIDMMTKRSNKLSYWTRNEICRQSTSKDRSMMLKKMLEIANLCLEWNNFHTSMIITTSLIQPCIQKLKEWSMLSSREHHMYQQLVKLLDVTNNMGYYRQILSKAKSPFVPFFPLLLKDITFFMDGNPTYLTSAAMAPPSTTTTISTTVSTSSLASSSLSSSSSSSSLSIPSSSSSGSVLSSSSSTATLTSTSSSATSLLTSTKLINFAKYRSLTRCVHGILRATNEDYWFASDLGTWPFLYHDSNTESSTTLDSIALQLENRIYTTKEENKMNDSNTTYN